MGQREGEKYEQHERFEWHRLETVSISAHDVRMERIQTNVEILCVEIKYIKQQDIENTSSEILEIDR